MTYPTDPFEQLHYNMVRAHHTFKLGYSSIIKHLDDLDSIVKDLPNFLGYCLAWTSSIISHHDSEEEMVFPFLNQKMDFSPEKKAHEVIHKSLSLLEAVLLEAKADRTKFNPTQIKQLLEQLKEALFSHLDAEVERIKPDDLRNSGFGEAELKDLNEQLDKYAQTHGDIFILVPYMMSHISPEFKGVWPPMPWYLRKLIIPYVLAWKHSGYWKYAPYALS